jgi:hypothetical protein
VVSLKESTVNRLSQLPPLEDFTYADLERMMGMLEFASTVLALLPGYGFAIKFFRRKMAAMARGEVTPLQRVDWWPTALSAFRQWLAAARANKPVRPEQYFDASKPNYLYFSDASDSGYGAVLVDLFDGVIHTFGAKWDPNMRGAHINVKEAAAVTLGLAYFSTRGFITMRGAAFVNLLIIVDNMSAMRALQKQRSSSFELAQQVEAFLLWLQGLSVRYAIEYVKTDRNPSDPPSRGMEFMTTHADMAMDVKWTSPRRMVQHGRTTACHATRVGVA